MPRSKKTLSTSTPRQGVNYLFTINNPTDNDNPEKWEYKYLIYQIEKGENETTHYQGYIIFKKKMSIAGLKKINSRAHWELRKGTHEQAVAYCSKKETRIDGPFIFGTGPTPGKRNDLLALKESLDKKASMKEIAQEHFVPFLKYHKGIAVYRNLITEPRRFKTEVTVLWGITGVGKSRICAETFPNAYWVFPQQVGKWWDGYEGEEVVIIDDFYGWFQHNYMLRLLDRYPMKVESKGGVLEFIPKKIFITSNKPPEEWYPRMEAQLPQLLRRIDNIYYKPDLESSFEKMKGKDFEEIFCLDKNKDKNDNNNMEPIPFNLSDDDSQSEDYSNGLNQLSLAAMHHSNASYTLAPIEEIDGSPLTDEFMETELDNNKSPKQYKRIYLNRCNGFLLAPITEEIQYDSLGEMLYCSEELSDSDKEEIERVLNIKFD